MSAQLEGPSTILIPVDLSPRSEQAVRYGARLAAVTGSDVVIMTVINGEERAVLEEYGRHEGMALEEAGQRALEQLSHRLAPNAQTSQLITIDGHAADGILDAADATGADMIVLASHGRGGMRRWLLGSVAEKVARAAEVPVVIVPARD